MNLSVTTPVGSLVEAEVDEITAPGVLGEMGVLPGHVPLLSALRPGVLTYRGGGQHGVLAVGKGFVEVVPGAGGGRIIVLVDDGMFGGQVDRAAAEKEIAELDARLAGGPGAATLDADAQAATRRRRDWAQARLDAQARAGAH